MGSESKQSNSNGKFLPASKEFEFRQYPFYWITRLSNLYTHEMEKRLKKQGMNITSWRVCMILRENGVLNMTDIATHAVGRLSTINKAVYRMQEQGLVKVERNENDARVTMVEITDEGRQTVGQLIESTSRIIERALTDLSAEEIKSLNGIAKHIFENLS